MAKRYHATKVFNRLTALNEDIDAGGHVGMAARRTKAKLADHWMRRGSTNTAGFYNAKKARDAKRAVC